MLRASIALLLHALTGLALPGAESSMDKRQDPDDIMMFVCDNYQGRSLSELCTGMCFGRSAVGLVSFPDLLSSQLQHSSAPH